MRTLGKLTAASLFLAAPALADDQPHGPTVPPPVPPIWGNAAPCVFGNLIEAWADRTAVVMVAPPVGWSAASATVPLTSGWFSQMRRGVLGFYPFKARRDDDGYVESQDAIVTVEKGQAVAAYHVRLNYLSEPNAEKATPILSLPPCGPQ